MKENIRLDQLEGDAQRERKNDHMIRSHNVMRSYNVIM